MSSSHLNLKTELGKIQPRDAATAQYLDALEDWFWEVENA